MKTIHVAPYSIGAGCRPLIVAELSGNHGQSLDRALRLVDAAAAAGAQALKLQTYTPDTMTLDVDRADFMIGDPKSLWHGRSLYDLYREAHTPWAWHEPLFERARERGMLVFSTPFDDSAVDFLETLATPCYKIASFENGDIPLIRRVAATGKPLLMSTGTATLSELAEAVGAARDAGCRDLILLKCTSSYPAEPTDANLMTLPHLSRLFDCPVGLSDHTPGTAVAAAAVALGACMVEKHFVLDRNGPGVDAAFSLEPDELARLVRDTRHAWQALGRVSYTPSEREHTSRRHRRSLFVVEDIRKDEPFTGKNCRAIRPGSGLAPVCMDRVIGRRASRNLVRGTPVQWDMIASP